MIGGIMSNDDKLNFRDHCAIEIFNSMISNPKTKAADYVAKISSAFLDKDINSGNKDVYTLYLEYLKEQIRLSYQLADLFRKVRLDSFE